METLSGKLLAEFATEYYEKLFYFCLKKTGDSCEAEELAADIALNIVAAIRKGTIPVNFPAWVWQIARNRYSTWAGRRRMQRESDSGADISEFELADGSVDIEGAWVHSEDLRLLRRELAFIASDYRNIIVAYYIDDKSVGEIGDMLGLPAGTIKSKLFRGRERLKEGMEMAREFGTMSYRPEQVGFSCCCNGFGRFGEPWNYLNRMLCKNILLAAYRTPSTAEELAVEIGVALPYMEDELRQLTEGTLLRQDGKKYETNFFILSARAQEKIYSHMRGLAPELSAAVEEAVEYRVKCLNEKGIHWHEGYQPYEDMKWVLLMQEVDRVRKDVLVHVEKGNYVAYRFTKRPNGGLWDIIGYENYEGEIYGFVGEHGGCDGFSSNGRTGELIKRGIRFGQYRFDYGGIKFQTRDWLSYDEVDTLAKLARGETSGLSEDILKELEESGYIAKGEDGYHPAFLVSIGSTEQVFTEEQEREYGRLRDRARDIALRQYLFSRETVLQEFPAFMLESGQSMEADHSMETGHSIEEGHSKEDPFQLTVAIHQTFELRGAVLEESLRRGYLAYDETQPRRMLGVYMQL